MVDAQTRTAKVRVLVANRDLRLKPGMFTSVSLSLPNSDSLTVPSKAVFVENSTSFAYVQVGDHEFARREVQTLARGSDRLRVVRGLAAGDRVVSDGVLLLRQLETDAPNPPRAPVPLTSHETRSPWLVDCLFLGALRAPGTAIRLASNRRNEYRMLVWRRIAVL